MANSSVFVCQQCGEDFSKWFGKCPNCGQWNSLVESVFNRKPKGKGKKGSAIINSIDNSKILKLTEIKGQNLPRIRTDLSELDRSLGGGLVPGQVVLLAGDPGIGKSTLLLQLSNNLKNTMYISGEESANQVSIRAKRLGINNKSIQFIESTDVDQIIDLLSGNKTAVDILIIDSIQTMSTTDLSGLSGSVGQVKESAFRLIRFAKSNNIPLVLVGHVTKEGTVAGPSVLMHMVDTVLWFEGDKSLTIRMLRAIKNRFGPTDEVGIFTMEEKGLKSIEDPQNLFLDDLKSKVPGSIVTAVMEGSRPLLVEVQGLVVPTKLPIPRRVATGFDSKRLEMILAVLTRRAGISLYEMDVFVNVAGGIKTKDTGIDLAVALSLASSFFDKPIPVNTLAVGEVGLLGEIRSVLREEKRVKEANRLGYKNIISSKSFRYLTQAVKENFKK